MNKIFLLIFLFPFFIFSVEFITTKDVFNPQLVANAIIRKEIGFERDFLVLHCLLKKVKPHKIFEVGTCEGYGTLIMANACPNALIISLELPPCTPPFFHELQNIGKKCNKPYKQVYGASLTYDYSIHFPIDAWFIDGAHDYIHVSHETKTALMSDAKIIIYHDADIEEVFSAIVDNINTDKYVLYRVTDTRIMYAVSKSVDWMTAK